jgi:4-amino-4-deoxy-L-arabinose transferase-like glycosyltransferase
MTAALSHQRADSRSDGPSQSSPAGRRRWKFPLRGRPADPVWVRPALFGLLAATAVLYLWDLGATGWANSFYTAAVQAGSQSWKAFFFGSFDSSNFITVDKPPVSLWVMALSVRAFGLNAWSVLVPQALEGVAAVGLLYATVRRGFSPLAGLFAGAVLALTPVATLMFRFNNPDALLVLLLVASAYAFTRALGTTSTRWLVACAVLVGTGFLTKMMQAFLVVPVFALAYLLLADTSVRSRIGQLLVAGVALVVASGWWVAIVELTPASARPYIGGSQDNSLLSLIFGYNGFGRLTGNETGSVGGRLTAAGRWGSTGLTRLFDSEFGGQVAWLIPAALILSCATLWLFRHAARTDQQRAQVLMWGGWLVVTGLTFSYAQGIIHPYYAVALAPAIAALVGIGATVLWAHRSAVIPRVALAVALGVTTWWSWTLLDRSAAWQPGLRAGIVVVGALATVAVLAAPYLNRRIAAVVAMTAVLVGIAGPAAYAVQTASVPHSGAIPSAGPAVVGARGPGRMGGPGGPLGRGRFGPMRGMPPMWGRAGGPATGAAGGLRGLLDARTPSATVVAALKDNAASYTWVAAAVGSNNAAGYQIASGGPVLAIGGFNGSDPSPTLAQFQALATAGKIHYFIAGGAGRGPGGGSDTAARITAWVQQSYPAATIGGTTVYDLTASPASG